MKRIEDIKEFKDIDTYYEISKIVEEVFQDRVEAHKHLVTANKEIERLNELVKGLREERDYLFNKTTTESNYEIERLNKELEEKEAIYKEQRDLIKRLLREMDSADEVIKQQYFEIERLNNIISKVKVDINNMKEIIREQPSEDEDTDAWIQVRLSGLLYIIEGSDKE